MINVIKEIWRFSESGKNNIRKSILLGFIRAIFNSLSIGAVFVVIKAILSNNTNKQTSLYALGLMLISIIGQIIIQYFWQLQMTHIGYFMVAEKRVSIGDRLRVMPMGYFNKNSVGDITGVATTVSSDLENSAPRILILMLGGLFNTLVFSLSILFYDYRIGLIVLAGIIVYLFATSVTEKKSRYASVDRQTAQSNLLESVLEAIQGMTVIKAFHLTDRQSSKVNKAIDDSCKYNIAMEKRMLRYMPIQQFTIDLFAIIMIVTSITFHLNGSMELLDCIMMIVASFMIFVPLKSAGSVIVELRITEHSMNKINETLSTSVMQDGNETKANDSSIEFKNVSFSYDKKQVLDNINLKIPQNTMTAIVGPSGSGKTTLCNLIARFWDTDSGEVFVGGKNVKDYTLDSLMENISMVFQNVYLFEDTIENNIKFGSPHATREDVIKTAKKAQAHEFISNLPQGYNTVVGEGGANLSGGEKQRISIARAMLKNAPIIIFDEATANVDPENEGKLQDAMEQLTKDKTVIMIAHRLKTVRNADQIIVLKDGKVDAKGTHEELIKKSPLYKAFVSNRNEVNSWQI
ncbi:ABC transporter ATP-binding protein [Inediibacterium massiliense]|uniref:ABC transporter ATP-binding protein n=1 Tax=Inediibacterium massiliense TaxID=1658111 RepID=UPI0006B6375E|nr:ABC transporter ATP-binding protein [Inediibacterium massiliense]